MFVNRQRFKKIFDENKIEIKNVVEYHPRMRYLG